jgi:hypothetical protein
MNASDSAIDSSFSLPPAIAAGEPHETPKRTFRVIVVDFALPEQRALSALLSVQERAGDTRIFLITISKEVSEEEQRIRSIRAAAENCPSKICRRFENAEGSWIHTMIFALLTSCCAITFFFAFQAPFRLRVVNEDLANPTTFRTEIAALPAPLKTQTIPGFRAHGFQQNAGYHQTDGPLDDSPYKRRVPRERPFQQKQSQASLQSGQLSGHN